MPEIRLEKLSVTYIDRKKRETVAIDDLSCVFPDLKTSVIVGPSGCGKTTLLRAVGGLLDFDGRIFSDGVDIETLEKKNRRLAYVMQQYALYPHLTVFDNLAFPLKVERCSYDEITSRVLEMAEFLQMRPFLSRKPRQLSGGQQQRIVLGRALIKHPSLVLLDEPLSNVDPRSRDALRVLIKRALCQYGATALYVTHSIKEATFLGDEIYVLDHGHLVNQASPLEIIKSSEPVTVSLFKEKDDEE